ncbi:hypothetical protein QOT17_018785 [Balamuthia mandrillaris]
MLKNSSANSKTDPKFLGPFIIHYCTNNKAYVLRDFTGNILPNKVPPSALKPVDFDTPCKDKHFEVEKVLNHDGPSSDCYYLMKWKCHNPALGRANPSLSHKAHKGEIRLDSVDWLGDVILSIRPRSHRLTSFSTFKTTAMLIGLKVTITVLRLLHPH